MPDYDMVVVGSGFAGSTATLSFLETTEKAGQAGRVAVIEAGKKGTWPGGSRWTKPFLRLTSDNTLSRDRVESEEQDWSDLDYWRKFEAEMPDTVEFMQDHGVKLIHHDEDSRRRKESAKTATPATAMIPRAALRPIASARPPTSGGPSRKPP